MNNEQSGVNTILLVIIIVALVGGLVWLYDRRGSASEDGSANINVTLPTPVGEGEGEGAQQ